MRGITPGNSGETRVKMIRLTLDLYLKAFSRYPSHRGITGGTIHQFIRESTIRYYGGKCPVWYIEHHKGGERCVIGGNYADGPGSKPDLRIGEELSFD